MTGQLMDLPTVGTWQGVRRRSPAQVRGEEPLDLVLWADLDRGLILGHSLVPSADSCEVLWKTLCQTMLQPIVGPPCRPTRLQVSKEMSLGLKQPAGELGIRVEVRARLPLLDSAFEDLEDHLQEEGFSYLDREGVEPSMIKKLAAAAVKLDRLAPWKTLPDRLMVALEGLTPGPLYCSILGNAGMEFGVAIFETLTGALHAIQGNPIAMIASPGLVVLYNDPDEMGLRTQDDVEAYHWPLTKEGQLVHLIRYGSDPGAPSPEDCRLATRVVEALLKPLKQVCRSGEALDMSVVSDGDSVRVRWPATEVLEPPRPDRPARRKRS